MAIDWRDVPPSLIRALRDENQHPVAGWMTPGGDFVSLELLPPEREGDPWVILHSDEKGVDVLPGGQYYNFEDAVDGFMYESDKMGRAIGEPPEYMAGSELESPGRSIDMGNGYSNGNHRGSMGIEFREGMSLYGPNEMDDMGSKGMGRSRKTHNKKYTPSRMNITFK